MPIYARWLALVILVLSVGALALHSQSSGPHTIRATAYNSHFPTAAEPGESFNGIGVAADDTFYRYDHNQQTVAAVKGINLRKRLFRAV